MDFDDFPMILGNLGVETDHPPKMCAGLRLAKRQRDQKEARLCPYATGSRYGKSSTYREIQSKAKGRLELRDGEHGHEERAREVREHPARPDAGRGAQVAAQDRDEDLERAP